MPVWIPRFDHLSFLIRRHLTDDEVRDAFREEKERLAKIGDYWRNRFEKADIYFLAAPSPTEAERPMLISSLGEPESQVIIDEVDAIGCGEFRNPYDITQKLFDAWYHTRKRHEGQMRFKNDKERFKKEVLLTPEDFADFGFLGDCDDFATWDLSMAQRVLWLYAGYLDIPAEDVMWAARYVIGQTRSGEGHASLHLADLKHVLRKGDKRPKCTWRNADSTTLFSDCYNWRRFKHLPDVHDDNFVNNQRVVWGSADNVHCYMKTAELPAPKELFYRNQVYFSHITETERDDLGEEVVDGMLGLLKQGRINVQAMKMALDRAEELKGESRYASLGKDEINYGFVGEVSNYLKGIEAANNLDMLDMIRDRSGVLLTLRLKYRDID